MATSGALYFLDRHSKEPESFEKFCLIAIVDHIFDPDFIHFTYFKLKMKFFQFLVATEAFMPKPGNKQFTMDNIDYNPQRDGK